MCSRSIGHRFGFAVAIAEPSVSAEVKFSLILIVMGGPSPARGAAGANQGSQRSQAPSDGPRRSQGVSAGEGLPVRLPRTEPDKSFVTGGQGVAGSNPAVPTRMSRSEAILPVWRGGLHDHL